MDHSKGSDDSREFIERRINDLDRRRDANLKEKLDAIEKFFNLSVVTKSEALNLAISRIQGENKDCAARCASQVRVFYDLINDLREKDTVKKLTIDSVKLEIVNVKNELDELYDTLEQMQLTSNQHNMNDITTITELKTAIKEQEKDLKRVPLKMIAVASLIGVAIVEVVWKLLVYIFKAAAKGGGLGI